MLYSLRPTLASTTPLDTFSPFSSNLLAIVMLLRTSSIRPVDGSNDYASDIPIIDPRGFSRRSWEQLGS